MADGYEPETFPESTLRDVVTDAGVREDAVGKAIRNLDAAIVEAGEGVRSDEPVNVSRDFAINPDGTVEFVGPEDASYRRRELKVEEANLSDAEFAVTDGSLEALAELDDVEADRLFRTGDAATLYETEALEEQVARVEASEPTGIAGVVASLASIGPDDLDTLRDRGVLEQSEEILQDRRQREARREITDAARESAREAGIDLEEFDVAAAYNEDKVTGEVVIQDKDTGRTRRIDADAPGGVGSAIDAATGDGQFVADDADPAASGSGSGDGLGARAAGAIVLLFGALAAALGWLS